MEWISCIYLCVPSNFNSLIFSDKGMTGSVTIYIVIFVEGPSEVSTSVLWRNDKIFGCLTWNQKKVFGFEGLATRMESSL